MYCYIGKSINPDISAMSTQIYPSFFLISTTSYYIRVTSRDCSALSTTDQSTNSLVLKRFSKNHRPDSLPYLWLMRHQRIELRSYSISQEICTRFVVLCFVVVMQSFIMNSHEVFIHIHQGCFAGTGAIVRLPQCQWSKPDGYGEISQCITTTKHSKAKTVCIFIGIYCMSGNIIIPGEIYVHIDIPLYNIETTNQCTT